MTRVMALQGQDLGIEQKLNMFLCFWHVSGYYKALPSASAAVEWSNIDLGWIIQLIQEHFHILLKIPSLCASLCVSNALEEIFGRQESRSVVFKCDELGQMQYQRHLSIELYLILPLIATCLVPQLQRKRS